MRAWIESIILGNLAKGLAAGQYGAFAQKVYLFGKGKVTWTAGALALIFQAASFFDNTGAAAIVAQLSAGLSGVALVRKGAHLEPPQIPQAMRDALEAGLSVVTWLLMAANGVIYICQQLHTTWACGISAEAQFFGLVLTAASGFLATYVSDPKAAALPKAGE
jgi:hypothetical protein